MPQNNIVHDEQFSTIFKEIHEKTLSLLEPLAVNRTIPNCIYLREYDAHTNTGKGISSEKLRKSNKAEFYSCDLTNYKNTKDTFQKILNDFGSIEGAIFNAGGDIKGRDRNASGGKAQNNSICIDIDDHDAIFDRNYRTCLNSIKAIVPILREQRFGKIITTSSASAGYGVTKETAYSTSKAAIIHLTRSVAAELREYDICVNCVAPGPTLTGRFKETISERTEKDLEKFTGGTSFLTKVADSIQISYLVEFLLSSKADYISGQVIRIDGGQFTSPI